MRSSSEASDDRRDPLDPVLGLRVPERLRSNHRDHRHRDDDPPGPTPRVRGRGLRLDFHLPGPTMPPTRLERNMNLDDLLPDRTDALHTLGHVLPDAFDADAALHYGGLKGWNLSKVPLVADSLVIPDKFAMIRNRGEYLIDSLGIVGPAAKVSQNEDLVPLLERLIAETGGHFDTAGSFDDGRKVFVSIILPGRRDEIED